MTAPTPATNEGTGALPAALEGLTLSLTVRVGRATRTVRDLAALAEGTEITLDAKPSDPVELCVEDRVVALGELTEGPDGGLAVRITEIAG